MLTRVARRVLRGSFRLGVALILGSPLLAGAAEIQDLRLVPYAEGTRLELTMPGAASASVFTLERPSRVVIDVRPATLDRHPGSLPAGQGLVRGIRTGPRPGGGIRLVLDVSQPVTARALPPEPGGAGGRRLRVEISAPNPARTASDGAMVALSSPAAPAPAPVAAAIPVAEHPASPARDLVIAVDAGHGGVDPGATGRDGTHEKDVTLAVARVLAARINAEPGMRAVLTRSGDYFVELRDRIRRAHNAQADLFVSVHADAIADRNVAGSSVYVLSARGATSEAAKMLADRENAADLVGGVSLDDKDPVLASVLLDLSQSAAMSASMVAAEKVLAELDSVGEVRKTRVQQAGFVVLKSPDIPSMLIETAYITNPVDERRLRDPQKQAALADAILAGVRNYFHENPPPGTRIATLVASRAEPAGGIAAGSVRALRR